MGFWNSDCTAATSPYITVTIWSLSSRGRDRRDELSLAAAAHREMIARRAALEPRRPAPPRRRAQIWATFRPHRLARCGLPRRFAFYQGNF